MKVVIASDKFKGSLSSLEVAEAVGQGILSVLPACDVVGLPVADGGDGTAEALVDALGGIWVEQIVLNPCHKRVVARYGVVGGDTVVMDVASASGLALLGKDERNPLRTTSAGTGELIRDAIMSGYRKFMIGLGGSATNDGAMGILSALGYRFMDVRGCELHPCGGNLSKVVKIDVTRVIPELEECIFTLLCDVDAEFYGKKGAAYVFAPQKGADSGGVKLLDEGLRSFAEVLFDNYGIDVRSLTYAGAAGGIGGGLGVVLGAEAVCGVEAVLQAVGFDEIVSGADFVVTGEGRMDRTTLLGKTPFGVCRAAHKHGVPVIAFAAEIADSAALNDAGFLAVFPIVPGVVTKSNSMKAETASANLRRTATQVFRLIDGLSLH